MPDTYYLDTSAHLERWTGTRPKREEIAKLLGDGEHVTSTHAQREWKHVTELAAAEILNAIEQSEDLADVFTRLSQLPFRQPKQVLRVLAMLTRGQTSLDATVAAKVRVFLRRGSMDRFRHQIGEIRDDSQCQLARNEVFRHKDGDWRLIWRCSKQEDICDQEAFIASREQRYRDCADALINNSPINRDKDIKMGERALEAAEKPVDGKGRACYGGLGDVSVAMECGADETVLTTDRSFETIGPALGLSVLRIAPS